MAFIRKKGDYYYLVASFRTEDGGVRQKVLAYLGKEPTISDKIRREVERDYPQLEIDWSSLMADECEEEEKITKVDKKDDSWLEWD